VAAGLMYIIVNLLLSWLARYAERWSRRNKKAAATAEVELPADMQMGGGGGVLPPK
jgi:glutamate transport system permease protein